MFDLFGMMDKIGKLKDAVEDVKNKCDRLTVEATHADGSVTVVTTVSKKIQSVSIQEAALRADNKEALEAAVLATVNDALREAHRTYKEEFKQGTEGLIPNIPGVDLAKFMGG